MKSHGIGCGGSGACAVVGAVRSPQGGMGLQYFGPVRCNSGVCVNESDIEYKVGTLTVFDGMAPHGLAVRPPSRDPLDARMYLNAFLVPCVVNGVDELQILGTLGR